MKFYGKCPICHKTYINTLTKEGFTQEYCNYEVESINATCNNCLEMLKVVDIHE